MEKQHVLERKMDVGSCRELRGHVHICTVYVDEPGHFWNTTAERNHRAVQKEVLRYLEREARASGVTLRFSETSERISTAKKWDQNNWSSLCEDFAHRHSCDSLTAYSKQRKAAEGADQIAFAFLFARPARSYATSIERSFSNADYAESIFIYDCRFHSYLHELLHLFGAVDLYFPESVSAAAARYFPNSVMKVPNSSEIDSLTRYLIGWTRTLSPEAMAMLFATGSVTSEDVHEALTRELSKSFDAKRTPGDDASHSRQPQDDAAAVRARHCFSDGSVYEGFFAGGQMHGKGKLRFSNGDVYEGEFRSNRMHGKGRYTFADRSVYEGDFANNRMHGKGRFRFANGAVYVGDFADGKMHGMGTLTFPGGTVQKGRFENNAYRGRA